MRILFLTSNVPSKYGEAVERVNLEIINQLANKGFKVCVQIIFSEFVSKDKDEKVIISKKIEDLNNDVDFLPALYTKKNFSKFSSYLRILFPTKKNIYPSFIHKKKIEELIKKEKIDLIFQSWDYPGLVAANEIKNIRKILYYGQPDHKPNLVRLADQNIFYQKKKSFFKLRKFLIERYNSKKEKIHVSMVNNFDEVHIICKAAHLDYLNAGVRKAQYTQNIWPAENDDIYNPRKNLMCKIVGSVGSNNATGNTVNFHYIGNELLKELNKLENFNYELNFFGKNEPLDTVSKLFNQSNVHFRGWVKDLDKELKSSDIFLICHNSIYKDRYLKCNENKWQLGGCHTRFLYAWSVGCPVVTHSANKIYMPEIEHGYNALMGDNPLEISKYIKKLYEDVDLRKELVSNGRTTLRKFFVPTVVVDKIFRNINNE
jgi:hypothetical protein